MIDSKEKGKRWERDIVKILNNRLKRGKFERVVMSGAIGTAIGNPNLMGDLVGRVYGISRPIKVEAKVGYGGEKQFTLKKEWLDKIARESEGVFGVPMLIGKFSGAKSGVVEFVVLDLDIFIYLLNLISDMKATIDKKGDLHE